MSEEVRNSRFTVYVPNPEVKFNLGNPMTNAEDGSVEFGFKGISFYVADHVYGEVTKEILLQTCGNAMWQIGGKLLQYSDANMVLSTPETSTVSAGNRLILAAGAGQGSQWSNDRSMGGRPPKVEDFIPLELHYQIEKVHSGVRQLFYGADGWKVARKASQDEQIAFDYSSKSPAVLGDGLLDKLREKYEELGYHPPAIERLLRPHEWTGNHLEVFEAPLPPSALKSSVYPEFMDFDPYASSGYGNRFGEIYGVAKQQLVLLNRFAHVLKKLIPNIVDSIPVASRAFQKFLSAWEKGQGPIHAALRFQNTPEDMKTYYEHFYDAAATRIDPEELAASNDTKASLKSLSEPFQLAGLGADQLVLEVLDKKDGDAKELELKVEALAAEPLSFTISADAKSGGKLKLKCDDAEAELDLDVLSKLTTLEQRAAALKAQLEAKLAEGSVSVSGPSVTVSSGKVGYPSEIVFPVEESEEKLALANAWFGVEERVERRGPEPHTAAWLAAQLGSLGMNFTVGEEQAEGAKAYCTLEHKQAGSASYLEIRGDAAGRLFGGNPVKDEGKAGELSDDLGKARDLRISLSYYPDDARVFARPIIEAFQEAVSMVSAIPGVFDAMMGLVGVPGGGPPSAIGLFADAGITLGTSGKITGAADGITLIASAADEKRGGKGIPLLEDQLIELLEKLDPIKYIWSRIGGGGPFKIPSKSASSSGIRFVSDSSVRMVSQEGTHITALGSVQIAASEIDFAATDAVQISSRKSDLLLAAGRIVVGRLAKDSGTGQEPTSWTRLLSAHKLEAATKGMRILADNDAIHLGTANKDAFKVELKSPRLQIDQSKIGLGVGEDRSQVYDGIWVDKSGNVNLAGSSKMDFQVGKCKVSMVDAKLSVTGEVSINGALQVKAMPAPPRVPAKFKVVPPSPAGALITRDYTKALTLATTLNSALSAQKPLLEAAQKAQDLNMNPLSKVRKSLKTAVEAQEKVIEQLSEQLAGLRVQRQQLIRDAILNDIDDQTFGRAEPAHTKLFGGE